MLLKDQLYIRCVLGNKEGRELSLLLCNLVPASMGNLEDRHPERNDATLKIQQMPGSKQNRTTNKNFFFSAG